MSRNVLDELAVIETYEQLKFWRIPIDWIGHGFGQPAMSDEQIRRMLMRSKKTFHTRDRDYYKPIYRHSTYSLVYYEVDDPEWAYYIRCFLRHPLFNTHAKRLGKVIKVTPTHIEFWEIGRIGKVKVELMIDDCRLSIEEYFSINNQQSTIDKGGKYEFVFEEILVISNSSVFEYFCFLWRIRPTCPDEDGARAAH